MIDDASRGEIYISTPGSCLYLLQGAGGGLPLGEQIQIRPSWTRSGKGCRKGY